MFEATRDLARRAADGPPAIVGTVTASGRHPPHHPGLYNAAALLRGGEVQFVAAKRLLPTYDVFFEARWFLPGAPASPVTIAGQRVGVLICEDMWDDGYDTHPPAELRAAEPRSSSASACFHGGDIRAAAFTICAAALPADLRQPGRGKRRADSTAQLPQCKRRHPRATPALKRSSRLWIWTKQDARRRGRQMNLTHHAFRRVFRAGVRVRDFAQKTGSKGHSGLSGRWIAPSSP